MEGGNKMQTKVSDWQIVGLVVDKMSSKGFYTNLAEYPSVWKAEFWYYGYPTICEDADLNIAVQNAAEKALDEMEFNKIKRDEWKKSAEEGLEEGRQKTAKQGTDKELAVKLLVAAAQQGLDLKELIKKK